MSFRGRLTLFFVLIVAVPMIAVAVLVVDVTSDARHGEADARLAASLETGLALYRDDLARSEDAARRIARDPEFGAALSAGERARLASRTRELARAEGLVSVEVRDRSGDVAVAIRPTQQFASVRLELEAPRGSASAGSLEASSTTVRAYLAEVERLTGREGAVAGADGEALAATMPYEDGGIPEPGDAVDMELEDDDVRVATAALPGSRGLRLALAGPLESGGFLSSSPVIAIILGGFFGLALLFVWMLLSTLQGQVAAMLEAARRIGGGDFSRTVPVVGRDEMAGLASEFNKMSERLSAQIDQLRRQRVEIERSVRRIGDAFASGLDRPALLAIVADTAIGACDAGYARITLRGHQSPEAEAGEASPETLEAVTEAERRALREGGTVEERRGDVHAIAAPLRRTARRGRVGAMTLGRAGGPFTPAERDVFVYLVGQASTSVENIALHELVSEQAVTDELTGLANARAFRDLAEKEVARAARFGHTLSLLMLDLDDFKQVNDTYGHLQGDEVLRTLGRILDSESRGVDEPARYGGEEFVIALPETDLEGAVELAERVRTRLESQEIARLDGGGVIRVTASVGAASIPRSAHDLRDLIAAADAALYRAKAGGKNRVETAPDDGGREEAAAGAPGRRAADQGASSGGDG